jgi:hypothetical protein
MAARFAPPRFHFRPRRHVLADVVDRENVGVIEGADAAGAGCSKRAASGAGSRLRRKNFPRDGAVEARIAGAIHLTHAAHAARGSSFVRASSRSRLPAPFGLPNRGLAMVIPAPTVGSLSVAPDGPAGALPRFGQCDGGRRHGDDRVPSQSPLKPSNTSYTMRRFSRLASGLPWRRLPPLHTRRT